MPDTEDDLEQLMRRGQAGDGEAHRALLRHLAGRLRRYFRGQLRRTGAPAADAEDLVQDTLLALHTHRHTYDGSAPVMAWTFGIARYKLIDHLRASARTWRDVPIDAMEELAADDPFQPVDTARELRRALEMLPSRFRLPIEYVKLEGLSIAEAAARIGISDAAVKIGIHRGMKRLAVALSEARP